MRKKTVRDLSDAQIKGKRALVRVDFNVPLDDDGQITDDTRIRAALPTLELLLERGCRPVILSHLGRPKGKPEPKYSLQPVSKRLEELLGKPVQFTSDCVGAEVETASKALGNGEVLLLENLRFHPEEEKNDPGFSKQLASLCDIYA